MDYQGNSHKSKEEEAKAEEAPPEKVLVKITTGTVVQKKKPFGHKFKVIFFGGEFKDVVNYIAYDVILPGVRDVVFDTIKNGAQRAIYGNRGPVTYSRQQSQPRVQYNNPVRRFSDPRQQQTVALPHQGPHPYKQNRMEMNDVIFSSREDAVQVLDTMINCVEMYGVVSLADLYELVGLPQSHIHQKWGWTHVTSTDIKQIRDGFLLELPPMEEI